MKKIPALDKPAAVSKALYDRLEQLYGPFPPFDDPDGFPIIRPLMAHLFNYIKRNEARFLTMVVGEWLAGNTIPEEWINCPQDVAVCNKLSQPGLIHFDRNHRHVALNEQKLLQVLHDATPCRNQEGGAE